MISAENVAQMVERMSAMGLEETQAFADRMRIEQPFVMVYLLAITEREKFTAGETEIFFFVGTVICALMTENAKVKHKVEEHDLDTAEEANKSLLEKMAGDSEGDFFSEAETLALHSPDPEVFRYIVESIMEDEEGNAENPPFSEEHIGAAFLHLKVLLDAFIAGQKKA